MISFSRLRWSTGACSGEVKYESEGVGSDMNFEARQM